MVAGCHLRSQVRSGDQRLRLGDLSVNVPKSVSPKSMLERLLASASLRCYRQVFDCSCCRAQPTIRALAQNSPGHPSDAEAQTVSRSRRQSKSHRKTAEWMSSRLIIC